MKEKIKGHKYVLKTVVIMLFVFASLFGGETERIKGAYPYESPYNGVGWTSSWDYDTSSGTGTGLKGAWPSGGSLNTGSIEGYSCSYLYNLGWSTPDEWELCADDTGYWVSLRWDDTWYYIRNAWIQVAGNWFFVGRDGYFVKGWAFLPVNGEKAANGALHCGWFHFDENNIMEVGWQKIDNKWYYFNLSDTADAGETYAWGECLYDTKGIPYLNVVADGTKYYTVNQGGYNYGKSPHYVTGFTFYQNIYVEGDSGYYLESSTPIVVELGTNNSCSKTVEVPNKYGYNLNPYGSSPGTVTNSLILVNDDNLSSALTKQDVNWYYDRSTYILYLNANGGTLPTAYDNVTLKYLTEAYYDISWNNPTRNGYTFNGWYTSTSGGIQVYDKSGKVVNEGTYWSGNKSVYAKEHTLYARWSANKYTVTYNAAGGTLTSGSSTASVAYGGAVSLASKASKDGLLFAGWGLSPTDKKPLSSLSMPANDVTLYALYSLPVSDMREAVLVSWSIKDPAVYNSFPMTLTKTSNGDYTYSLSGINLRNGLSYSSDSDVGVALILDDNAGNRRIINIKRDEKPPVPELYPQTVNHYLWNIEANRWVFYASTSELAYENSTYTPAYLQTVPTGYHKDSIDAAYKVTGATTTSAYYRPNEYTLYFDANGGSCDTASKVVYKDYFYGELPVAQRKGYEFLGWYTDPKNGTKIASSDRYEKAGDSTVYAHWKVDKHMVVYDYITNGGNAVDISSKEMDYGSPFDISIKAYKKDWDFVGWNVNPKETTVLSNSSSWHCETCGETHNVSSVPSHDIVLYAIFKKDIVVTIVEQTDSGTNERKLSETIYNNEISADFTITEETAWHGWELLGWTTEKNAEAQPSVGLDSVYTAKENTTLYGVYSSEITVSYDTNGSSASFNEQKKECYYNASGTYFYPMFTLEKEPLLPQHSFVGWEDGNGNVYAAGEEKEFTKDTLLVAKWDKYPEIEAYDRYFTLEDAQNGEITEEALLEKVKGTDLEDGILVNGVDVVVKDYDTSDFTNMTTDTEVKITYQATDSFGNVVEKTITVKVTDTTMKKSTTKKYVRFISSQFFKDDVGNMISSSQGGLEETSIWRTNSIYLNLLESTLSNKKTNVETKVVSAFGIEWEVEIAGSGEWEKKECDVVHFVEN